MHGYAASIQVLGQKLRRAQGRSFSPGKNPALLLGAHLHGRATAGFVSQGGKLFLQPALPGVADGPEVNSYLPGHLRAGLAFGQQ